VHAPGQKKSDDSKHSFYEGLQQVFDSFPKCPYEIILGDFNEKLGREDILKLTIGNDIQHQDRNDNSVRIVNF
jgi:hypothetical protein